MQIVVYTPPYEKDGKKYTYVPHLIEHCVYRPEVISIDSFYNKICKTENLYLINFSIYNFSNNIPVDKVKKMLSQDISLSILDGERKIIKQEIEEYDTKADSLKKAVERKHYKGKYQEDEIINISNTELISYHKNYYSPDKFIVSDHYGNLQLPKKYPKLLNNNEEIKLYKGSINFNGVKGYYICGSNISWKIYFRLLFIKKLITDHSCYINRYKTMSEFDYPITDWFMSIEDWFVVYPPSIPLDISKKFFESCKIHFLETIFTDYTTEEYAYYNIIHKGMVSKEMVLNHIKAISFKETKEILDHD